ncbi:MAG: hydrogenase maturation protease [Pseudanabaena sp. CRU_2_10]|nr:hydrogenase maturation protease [Pseudanabaena sp. CRU_2_10]
MNINELEHIPPQSQLKPCLVIGYGNTLRGDDGAGQKVAEIVADWELAQVRSLPAHQLTPEFAALLAESELAIFVDVYPVTELAIAESAEAEIKAIPIHPSTYRHDTSVCEGAGHAVDPHSLLCLAEVAYGHAPTAWWILIPATNFEFSEQLSSLAQAGIAKALQKIEQIVERGGTQPGN